MPASIQLGISVLLLGGWLIAGCATPSPRKGAPDPSPVAEAAPEASVNASDYSPEAVAKRTDAHAHYATAVIHELNEEPELAVEEYFKAAGADLSNESLVLDVSRRLLQLKQNERAKDLLSVATADPDASGELFARLGLVYSILNEKEKAIAANRKAIQKTPSSFDGYQHLGQIYLQSKQFDEGLKVLDEAASQPDADIDFLVKLSELYASYLRAGGSESVKTNAMTVLDRAANMDPTNPIVLQRLADGYALMGESEKALPLYLKLLERFPGLPGLREKLTDVYLRRQDRKKAAEQLEAIIRANPTNPQAYYFLGSIAFEEKNPKQAVEYFEKTLLLSPNFEAAYYDLAGAHINLNQPQEALAVLERAKLRFRQTFVGEFFAAMAYNRLKDYPNAINHLVTAEVIARATDTNRLTHIFYYQLGSTYERNHRYEEAEKYFVKCLEMAPDFGEAMNYMGYMWTEQGVKLEEARALIEKAVKLEPRSAAFLDSLGWVLFRLGRAEEGLKYLLQSIEHSEEPDATLFDHLGDIYTSLQQPDKAGEAWRKSLAIEPNDAIQKKLGAPATGKGATK